MWPFDGARRARRARRMVEGGPSSADADVGQRQRDQPVGAVVVARGDPDAVAAETAVADAAVLALQEPDRLAGGAVGVDGHPPDRLAAQRRQVDGSVGADGDPARRHLARGPLGDRVDEVGVARLALDLGPAVVLAGLDEVELVVGVLAELTGPHALPAVPGEALDVAVAVRPDRGASERVAGRGVPVRSDAKDLAAERVEVLRQGRVAGLAGADVEVAVRPEGDAATVVVAPAGDAREDHGRFTEPAVTPGHR